MNSTKPPRVIRPSGSHSDPRDRGSAGRDNAPDFEFGAPAAPGIPWLGLGMLIGGAATGFYFSDRADFLLGEVAAVLLGAFGLHGLWRGGFRKLVMLPVTIGVLVLVSAKPDFADPLIRAVRGESSLAGNMAACALAIVGSLLTAGWLVRTVRQRVIIRRPMLLGADRFVGATVGLAEGGLLLLVICWAVVLAEKPLSQVKDHTSSEPGSARHALASGMLRFVADIDGSPLQTLVRNYNYLESVPSVQAAIQQMEQAAANPEGWNGSASGLTELLQNVDPAALGELGEVAKRLQSDSTARPGSSRRAGSQRQ
ncbi:MAG: CvpA family protein [Phycisphaerae bacterium]|nr:CvpA family protein [Phycisphaerae bacterium]